MDTKIIDGIKKFYQLKPREIKVLEMRLGLWPETEPKSLEEVGKEFNVTRERVRQIEAKALEQIFN